MCGFKGKEEGDSFAYLTISNWYAIRKYRTDAWPPKRRGRKAKPKRYVSLWWSGWAVWKLGVRRKAMREEELRKSPLWKWCRWAGQDRGIIFCDQCSAVILRLYSCLLLIIILILAPLPTTYRHHPLWYRNVLLEEKEDNHSNKIRGCVVCGIVDSSFWLSARKDRKNLCITAAVMLRAVEHQSS